MVLSGAVGLAWGCARELSAILFAPVREAASTGRTEDEDSTREARDLSRRSEAHLVKAIGRSNGVHSRSRRPTTSSEWPSTLSPGVLGPQYFRDMAELLSGGAPDPAKMKETMLRYGLIPAPPS